MHFNRLIILLFVNVLLSQAYYESAIGMDYNSYSARSLSLASSSQISEQGAYSLLFNPSNILLICVLRMKQEKNNSRKS